MGLWWDDLGDDELYVRLVQRDVPVDEARRLADAREHDVQARARIAEVLT